MNKNVQKTIAEINDRIKKVNLQVTQADLVRWVVVMENREACIENACRDVADHISIIQKYGTPLQDEDLEKWRLSLEQVRLPDHK